MTANAYILQPTPTGGCMKKYSETPPALTKCSSEHSETSAAPAAMASEASETFAAVAGKASERSETFAAPAAAASECSAAPAVTTGNSCSPHAEDYLPHADYADCHRKARAGEATRKRLRKSAESA